MVLFYGRIVSPILLINPVQDVGLYNPRPWDREFVVDGYSVSGRYHAHGGYPASVYTSIRDTCSQAFLVYWVSMLL